MTTLKINLENRQLQHEDFLVKYTIILYTPRPSRNALILQLQFYIQQFYHCNTATFLNNLPDFCLLNIDYPNLLQRWNK